MNILSTSKKYLYNFWWNIFWEWMAIIYVTNNIWCWLIKSVKQKGLIFFGQQYNLWTFCNAVIPCIVWCLYICSNLNLLCKSFPIKYNKTFHLAKLSPTHKFHLPSSELMLQTRVQKYLKLHKLNDLIKKRKIIFQKPCCPSVDGRIVNVNLNPISLLWLSN